MNESCPAQSAILPRSHVADHLNTDSPFSFRLSLQGLDYGCRQGIDFYQPLIRQFWNLDSLASHNWLNCIRQPPVIEPITLVTVWKGLTFSDCESLISIQDCFISCLEQLLEGQFTHFQAQLFSAWRSRCQGTTRAECPVFHRFVFSKAQLVQAISAAVHVSEALRCPDDETDAEELLMLYLWSRDYMFDLPREQTAVSTRGLCSPDSETGCPKVSTMTALCTADYLSFEGLDVLPQEGSEILIKPYYRTNALQRPGGPHTKVTYSLGPDQPLWLHWDTEVGAFRGLIPRYSEKSHAGGGSSEAHRLCSSHRIINVLKFEVKALIVVAFPDSRVRIERTIRVRLALRITGPRLPVGPSYHTRITDASTLPTHKSASESDLRPLTIGFKAHLNPSLSPSSSRNKRRSTYLTFSNIPGINLQALKEIGSQPNRLVVREPKRGYTPKGQHLSSNVAAQENKCSQAAEAFVVKFTHFNSKNRKRSSRSVGSVVPVKQQTPHDAKMLLHTGKLGPASPHYCNTTLGARNKDIRSVVDQYTTTKRRQDRSSKITPFSEELRFMHSMDGQAIGRASIQTAIRDHDPSDRTDKHGQGSSNVCTPPHANTFPQGKDQKSLKFLSTPMLRSRKSGLKIDSTQNIISSNRYAILQSLSPISDNDLDADLLRDKSDFGLLLPRIQPMQSEQVHRRLDSACYVEEASTDLAHENTDSVQHEGWPAFRRRHALEWKHCRRGRGLKPLPLKLTNRSVEPTSEMPVSGPATASVSQDNDVQVASTPMYSCRASNDFRGGDPYSPMERMIIHRISTMAETMEAYREPGLSNDEREQKWKAMKKSLETGSASGNNSRLVSANLSNWDEEFEAMSDIGTNDGTMAQSEEELDDEI